MVMLGLCCSSGVFCSRLQEVTLMLVGGSHADFQSAALKPELCSPSESGHHHHQQQRVGVFTSALFCSADFEDLFDDDDLQ